MEDQINALSRSSGQGPNLQLFGRNVPQILTKIKQRARQFRDVPVGPVGLHVKLADGMNGWEAPIEACIGKTLKTFVVTNHGDAQKLKQIFRECNDRETDCLILPKHSRYNVADKSPDGLLTIEQVGWSVGRSVGWVVFVIL